MARLPAMAWRNLWRNRRRTVLTLASIGFGGFLAVIMTAFQDRSFSDFIDTAARLGGGHVTLQHPEYLDRPALNRSLLDSGRLREIARTDADVQRVVTRISGQFMLSTAYDNFGAYFIAFDPAAEDEHTMALAEGLVAGEWLTGPDDKGIVVGQRLASNLNLGLGKKIVFTLTDKRGEIVTGMARLTGIVETGAPSLDAGLCLLGIDTVRSFVGFAPDEATQVAVFVADSRRSAAVAKRLRSRIGPEIAALTWDETQPQLAGFIAMKVGGGRVMELIILILVAAGIFNTLFVSVMERISEFGIMIAIGFTPGQLFRLVMLESLWLGMVGLAAGGLMVAGPYFYLAEVGIDISAMVGEAGAEVAGVGFNQLLMVGIYPQNLLLIAAAVVCATMAAGLYPAWRAGTVVPVETIKVV